MIVNGKGFFLNTRASLSASRAVFFAVLLLACLPFVPVHAQTSSSPSPESPENSTQQEDYLNQSIDLETGENTGALTNFSENTSQQNIDTSDSSVMWYITKTMAVLVVLSLGIWGILKFLKRSGFGGASNQFMSIHSTLAVGQNQYLQIVQVGKQFFIIGVTDNNVNMLGEITDSEMVTDLQLNGGGDEDNQQSGMNDFGDLLSQFTGTSQHGFNNNDGDDQDADSESQLSDLKNKLQDMRQTGGQA